jgi:SPP1 gp7 family putative phage head morphogenesis protein
MSLDDARRLYDVATRVQVFVEGVKLYQQQKLDIVLNQLTTDIVNLVANLRYDTLDGLTKAELLLLLNSLNKLQYSVYSKYTQGLIEDLQAFMAGNLVVNKIIYATTYNETQFSNFDDILSEDQSNNLLLNFNGPKPVYGLAAPLGKNNGPFWSTITNAPIPANGVLLPAYVSNFGTYAQATVINRVRMAYANGQSKQELIDLLTQSTKHGTNSLMDLMAISGSAMISTSIQHIASIGAMAIASIIYSYYQWCSVIDTKTSAICRERNGRVYKTGDGPLPPAHTNCRSHTVPIVGDKSSDLPNETFYEWNTNQPKAVKDEIGVTKAGQKYQASKPLSVTNFVSMIKTILTR